MNFDRAMLHNIYTKGVAILGADNLIGLENSLDQLDRYIVLECFGKIGQEKHTLLYDFGVGYLKNL
jgi:hypothetical protein